MKININIKKEVQEVLLAHQEQSLVGSQGAWTSNVDSLSSSLKELFELHLNQVITELLDESAFGTIHIHTGKRHELH